MFKKWVCVLKKYDEEIVLIKVGLLILLCILFEGTLLQLPHPQMQIKVLYSSSRHSSNNQNSKVFSYPRVNQFNSTSMKTKTLDKPSTSVTSVWPSSRKPVHKTTSTHIPITSTDLGDYSSPKPDISVKPDYKPLITSSILNFIIKSAVDAFSWLSDDSILCTWSVRFKEAFS